MKPSILFLLTAALGASALLSGCACSTRRAVILESDPTYSRVVSSDFEGRWIAEFVAEGPVRKTEGGFAFTAVQRRIFKPTTMEFHYPLGRPMKVIATNVIVTPANKPLWLERLDEHGSVASVPASRVPDKVVSQPVGPYKVSPPEILVTH